MSPLGVPVETPLRNRLILTPTCSRHWGWTFSMTTEPKSGKFLLTHPVWWSIKWVWTFPSTIDDSVKSYLPTSLSTYGQHRGSGWRHYTDSNWVIGKKKFSEWESYSPGDSSSRVLYVPLHLTKPCSPLFTVNTSHDKSRGFLLVGVPHVNRLSWSTSMGVLEGSHRCGYSTPVSKTRQVSVTDVYHNHSPE